MNLYSTTICDGAGFRQVLRAGLDEQHDLLNSDDPRERVWASWCLGLQLGEAFLPELRDLAAREPVAGVRRHLVVMLAGLEEIDIVAAFARNDRDERVRATAAQYVASLAPGHRDLFFVLETVLADPSPIVRAAAVQWMPEEAPQALRERAHALRENDEDVRVLLQVRDETVVEAAEELAAPRGELTPYEGTRE